MSYLPVNCIWIAQTLRAHVGWIFERVAVFASWVTWQWQHCCGSCSPSAIYAYQQKGAFKGCKCKQCKGKIMFSWTYNFKQLFIIHLLLFSQLFLIIIHIFSSTGITCLKFAEFFEFLDAKGQTASACSHSWRSHARCHILQDSKGSSRIHLQSRIYIATR